MSKANPLYKRRGRNNVVVDSQWFEEEKIQKT
jgi:hypothetical protein